MILTPHSFDHYILLNLFVLIMVEEFSFYYYFLRMPDVVPAEAILYYNQTTNSPSIAVSLLFFIYYIHVCSILLVLIFCILR